MTPTVAEIVALPVVRAGEPEVLSAHGLDRPVRWVHVSDVPDLSGLLQGGELVLTTGSALRAAPRRYLAGLAAAGAVGVVVEVAVGGPLPAAAGAAAADCGLALVALHRVIRFVEVTEQVHRAIVADQYDEVAFARRTHEIFTDLGMRRGSPADIVEATARLLDSPVVLEDLAHQGLAVATAGARPVELLRNWERRSRLHAAGVHPPDTAGWIAAPVGRAGEEWGRLIATGAPPGARTTMVLERAAQALVMHRMAERDRSDLEHRAQAGLLDDVLRQRVRSTDEVLARASALGLSEAGEYVPATARARDWSDDADPVTGQRRSARLLDAVARAVRSSGHTGLFSVRGPGEIGMVLALRTGRGRSADDALRALGHALRREQHRLALGIADPATDLIEAIRRIGESAHVAAAAVTMPDRDRDCFRVADIRLRGLVSMLRTDPRVQRFAEAELRTVILHDLETGDRWLDVLRGYLELGGNKTALAARLHLSRPALYAKLARIQELLGVDLSDGESATSLHVALLVLDAQSTRA